LFEKIYIYIYFQTKHKLAYAHTHYIYIGRGHNAVIYIWGEMIYWWDILIYISAMVPVIIITNKNIPPPLLWVPIYPRERANKTGREIETLHFVCLLSPPPTSRVYWLLGDVKSPNLHKEFHQTDIGLIDCFHHNHASLSTDLVVT